MNALFLKSFHSPQENKECHRLQGLHSASQRVTKIGKVEWEAASQHNYAFRKILDAIAFLWQ